jgi:serine/threonine protein kinase
MNMKNGGNVLGSGSYGCVFLPALKCQGEEERPRHKISKLMTDKYAKEEYYQIVSIRKKLSTIPQWEKYFLLQDITLCKPASLTESDLMQYSTHCHALPKDRIYASNINMQLDKMMSLNMPDGGISLDEYLYQDMNTNKGIPFLSKCYQMNRYLIPLLEKGIVPMNKRHVYHGDIKDSNVLVSMDTPTKVRLIDWGLATEYTPGEAIPKHFLHCALQFNAPFSILLFSDNFREKYAESNKRGDDLETFLFNYLTWFVKQEEGHYKVINEIVYMLVANDLTNVQEKDKPQVIETQYTLKIILHYLAGVLKKYTYQGEFQAHAYFNAVFIRNLDIWGFVCCYLPVLQILSEHPSRHAALFHMVKQLFLQFLFQQGEEPISVSQLVKHLQKIHKSKHGVTKHTSTVGPRHIRRQKSRSTRRRSFTKFQKPFLLSIGIGKLR